jgi:hypothetical protein
MRFTLQLFLESERKASTNDFVAFMSQNGSIWRLSKIFLKIFAAIFCCKVFQEVIAKSLLFITHLVYFWCVKCIKNTLF